MGKLNILLKLYKSKKLNNYKNNLKK